MLASQKLLSPSLRSSFREYRGTATYHSSLSQLFRPFFRWHSNRHRSSSPPRRDYLRAAFLSAFLTFLSPATSIITLTSQVVDGVVHVISIVHADRIPVAEVVNCKGLFF